MLIYIPLADAGLIKYAGKLNEFRKEKVFAPDERYEVLVHGSSKKLLAGVGKNEILYLLAHGRETTNNEIAGMVKNIFGKVVKKNMTASSLAKQMQNDGLVSQFTDLRLLVCWAGLFRQRGGDFQVPFAGQLCGALKEKGYSRIMVTGFVGAVAMVPTRNVVIEPGEIEKDSYDYEAIYADQGMAGAGRMKNTGDEGQSMTAIVMTRDPIVLKYRSTWY